MYYDIYVAEVYNGSLLDEAELYNSKQTDMKNSIKSVIDFIKEHYSGCIYNQIKSITEVKTKLENDNYYKFKDFDGHTLIFILRKWDGGWLRNRDIVTGIDVYEEEIKDEDYES